MTPSAKLDVAAIAAVVVLAVVGFTLNNGGGSNVGGPAARSSAPPSSPQPSPSQTPVDVWERGPYDIGRHEAILDGRSISFNVPTTGWSGNYWTGMIVKGQPGPDEDGWVGFTWSFDMVATDPCNGGAISVGPTMDDLATAITTIPGTHAGEPEDTTVDGRPAKVVEFTIDDDIGCAPNYFMLYGPASAYPNSTDSTIKDWIFEVDGKRTGIHADVIGDNPELWTEIQEIIDSVRFE